jgi:hypothetical protein
LTRFCKGADNSGAVEEQKKARRQSAFQFQQQMKLAEKQFADSQEIKTPELLPASPVPSQGIDTGEAGRFMRRRARRRFGAGKTVFAGESAPSLGGAVALAA